LKHKITDDVNVNVNLEVDIRSEDIKDVIYTATACGIIGVGFYIAADTLRCVVKSTLK
jgi:hypothetical protein